MVFADDCLTAKIKPTKFPTIRYTNTLYILYIHNKIVITVEISKKVHKPIQCHVNSIHLYMHILKYIEGQKIPTPASISVQ